MSDELLKAMLELAAKAAGYDVVWVVSWSAFRHRNPILDAGLERYLWDPENDDGDSRRLQVDTGLTLARFDDAMVAMHQPSGRSWAERHDAHPNSFAAARLAVLRAASELDRNNLPILKEAYLRGEGGAA
jgi:hypothetical protein